MVLHRVPCPSLQTGLRATKQCHKGGRHEKVVDGCRVTLLVCVVLSLLVVLLLSDVLGLLVLTQ